MYNRTIISGHSEHHIPVRFFIMKEDLDLLIEDKWSKRYVFANLIAAIEKLPIAKERNHVLNQGSDFINVYNIFF